MKMPNQSTDPTLARAFMRRFQHISLLFLVAIALSGCASALTRNPRSSLVDDIMAKEREGLDALKAGDLVGFSNLTADDAVFIDPHGIASKADVMRNVAGFRLENYSIENLKLVPLSDTSGLIAYDITEKGNSHGRAFSAKAYISALWVIRKGEWTCVFSQETPRK
jgi:ketosteroid isomerase-like protein